MKQEVTKCGVFLGSKKRQHTIEQTIDHQSGKFLACAFGDRKNDICKDTLNA